MMKPLKPFNIFLLFLLVHPGLFSQTSPVLSYLPKDAKAIIKINPARLGQKIKWDELLKYKMFEDLMKETPEAKDFLKDPAQIGIDLDEGLIPDHTS